MLGRIGRTWVAGWYRAIIKTNRCVAYGRFRIGLLECGQPDAARLRNQMALGHGLAANDGVKPLTGSQARLLPGSLGPTSRFDTLDTCLVSIAI